MKQVINQLNYNFSNNQVAERNRETSKTVPEQSLSVKQIIDRFTKGLPVTAKNYEAQYNGNIYSPDINKMDLVEQQEIREYARDKVKEFQDAVNQQIKDKKDAEQKAFTDWKEEKQRQKAEQEEKENQQPA